MKRIILIVTTIALAMVYGFGQTAGDALTKIVPSAVRALPPIKVESVPASAIQTNAAGMVVKYGTPASRQIKLIPGGALADFGLPKVLFPADVNGEQPIAVTGPDGRELTFRPRLLAWHDTSTGQRWLLAQVTNRVGMVIGSAKVLYTNAFDSLNADLRYRYTKHGLEQDVILREQPELPKGVIAENAQLEVWTEWFDAVPTGNQSQTVDLRQGSSLASGTHALVADQGLSFGAMRVGLGYAFSTGTPDEGTPVAKTWQNVDGRDWLIETVDFAALKPKLDALNSLATNRTAKATTGAKDLIGLLARSSNKSERTGLFAKADGPETPGVIVDFAILSCAPLAPNAVSWWPAGGSTADVIGNNHGSLSNGVTYAAAEVGQGFRFPTSGSGFVRVPDHASLHFTNALTIEAWIKPSALTDWQAIVDKWDMANSGRLSYTTWLGPDGQLFFLVSSTGYDASVDFVGASSYVPANAWTHIAATYDGSMLRIYLNGVLDAYGTYTGGIFPGTNDLGIGAMVDDGSGSVLYPFQGSIDEPTVYNRALSLSEIQAIYNAGAAGKWNPNCVAPPANVVAWWSGDSTNAYDLARTNMGALQGGVTNATAVVSNGFSFDGVNDAIVVPHNDALNFPSNQNFTIEAWVNALSNNTAYGVTDIVTKRKVADDNTVLGYEFTLVNGQLTFQVADAPLRSYNWATWNDTTDLRDGGYHHVAVTFDRASTTGGHLYVDGVAVLEFNPKVMPGPLTNAEPLRIGMHAQTGFNGYYKGIIDEVSIYQRALSATEISSIAIAGRAGKCKADTDVDGLLDLQETFLGTNPNNADSDGDGIKDGDEVFIYRTNPMSQDSDGDGMIDQPFSVSLTRPKSNSQVP